jgi:hypothetical protein
MKEVERGSRGLFSGNPQINTPRKKVFFGLEALTQLPSPFGRGARGEGGLAFR